MKLHYTTQDPAGKYGTAVPIAMAVEEYNIDEPVYVFMGDDFIWNPGGKSSANSLFSSLKNSDESAILGVEVQKDEVDKYGVLSEKDGELVGIVEKPEVKKAPSNLINVSKYIMSPALLNEIVDYVNTNDFGPKGQEYVVTDPIASYIKGGGVMRVATTKGEFLDGGSVEGWLHANNVVLGS